jgi:hypothetical protein
VIRGPPPPMNQRPRKQACHLWRSRHGTHYFRAVLPASLRTAGSGLPLEVRRSVRTGSWREALVRARPLRVGFDLIIAKLNWMAKNKPRKPIRSGLCMDYLTITKRLPDGSEHSIRVDQGSADADGVALEKIGPALGIATTVAAHAQPGSDSGAPLLSALAAKYLATRA